MIKPVAFYRGDYRGDVMFRKNNTLDVRKNRSDFTKGWIKPLYSEDTIEALQNKQALFTIPKDIAKSAESRNKERYTGAEEFEEAVWEWAYKLRDEYLTPFEEQLKDLNDKDYEEVKSKIKIPDEIEATVEQRFNIIRLYLIGKALNIEFVRVEEE
ncbi:MAG: hypothetical protein LBH78_03435 [Rickettsiales bacterium]|jgi:hypothetical protein|nr:hypothetical protein [Rickettsiales bacterium]